MNQITPYEQLVAQEMEHLPLPDSMESIWLDIESQLDVDLPSGGGKNPPPRKPAPRRSRWTNNWRLYVIAGTIITILFIAQNRKRKNGPDRQRSVTPQEKTIIPDSPVQQGAPPASDKNIKPAIKRPVSKDPVSVVTPDTSLLKPSPILEPPASIPVNPPIIIPGKTVVVPSPPPPKDSLKTPGRKPRGIPDINDSDYRIVPQKKDSTQKKP